MLIIYRRLGIKKKVSASLNAYPLRPSPSTDQTYHSGKGWLVSDSSVQFFFSLLIRMVESTNKGLDPWNIPQRLFSMTLYLVL